MGTIEHIFRTPSFKRDWKRLVARHVDTRKFEYALHALVNQDQAVLQSLRDHTLSGEWKGYRELHVHRDWLLIYRIDAKSLTLILVRSGSHDQLL
ncbi:type II toxin-antitoxin system YafQ family toxin [Bifidobacterium sp.]|uniref:type II toxin-antitoxin system RelE/ParE family toxin n=1 Tax=Bifidobacterium sp. TaxID=41200 RepID=UPI0039E9888F